MLGKKLGQYKITEEIGKGGMAVVYRAYHKNMDRHVAIKIIHSRILMDKTARERFQREARLIAKLEHPHLLPVYDFEGENDPPYIVMRFLEGGTLKRVIEKGNLPQGEALYMLRQIAAALDYAHRQGVIHRDMKPSNIMIDKEGNAFVADFGIARIENPDGKNLTETGAMLGTPAYMAPEQARSLAGLDHRVDIYALGVIVYEMLCGQHPYPKENGVEVLMAHIQDPVPNICDVDNRLPLALGAVLERALAKDKTARYASAGALIKDVAAALDDDASSTPEVLRGMTVQFAADQLAEFITTSNDDSQLSGTISREHQRQMTVVYLDISTFAEILYETEEPDVVRQTVEDLWLKLTAIAEEYDGQLESRTAEAGVLLWGRDAAQENDPEQAVQATLAIKEAIRMETDKRWGEEDEPLPFRAGVTTGPVLLTRESDTDTYTTSGITVTLASRLKESAPSGEILLAHNTYTHVRGIFDVEALAPLRLRGGRDELGVYLLRRARARAFHQQTRGIEGIETAMIGREIELRVLQEALDFAVEDHETQVVTVVGAAGVGKSRLLSEFFNWAHTRGEDLSFFQARATQPSQVQPYSLTRDLFSFRFEIADNDPLKAVHEKFITGINGFLGEGSAHKARMIGQLVGFDFSEDPAIKGALSAAEVFQTEALGYLGEFFTTATEQNPVFIQVEDIHWADDRSLDLLNNLARENQKLPLFIVYMSRPSIFERRSSWGEGESFHHKVQLQSLSRLAMRGLVKELLKQIADVPTALRDLIIERAEGNPFYAEELVKMLIDDGVIIKGEKAWTLNMANFSVPRIPPTLTGLLQARLDALDPAQRALLQRASVVGRVFWERAAAHLSQAVGVATDTTVSLLESLRNREMILKREKSNFEGTAEYLFRHAILRDVTYESIVPHQRRTYHKLVAEWLVTIARERIEEYAPLIAEHYEMAREQEQAAHYLRLAARRMFSAGAGNESLVLIEKALDMLSVKDYPVAWAQTVLERTNVLYGAGKYGEVQKHLQDLMPIAQDLPNMEVKADFFTQYGRVFNVVGEFEQSRELLQKALTIVQTLENRPLEAFVLRQLGHIANSEKRSDDGIDYASQSRVIGEALGDIGLQVSATYTLATAYSLNPEHHELALETYNEGIEMAHEYGIKHTLLYLLSFRSVLHLHLKAYPELRAGAEETLRLALEQGNFGFVAVGHAGLAQADIYQGQLEAARQHCCTALSIFLKNDSPALALDMVSLGASILLAEGAPEKSLAWFGMVAQDGRLSPGSGIRDTQGAKETFGAEIDEVDWTAGLEKGYDLVLDEVVAEILAWKK